MNTAIYKFIAVFVFLSLSGHTLSWSQSFPNPAHQEAGLPIIQNFSPKDYNAYSQNWAIVQAPNGLMYFGNGSGVLEYDGVSWRLIPVSNNTVVRSLAVDENGIIYVGARGDLGYLAPDSSGSLCYISLIDRVKTNARDFGDVWETHASSRGVFFRTQKFLFLLERDKMPIALSEKSITSPTDTLRYWWAEAHRFAFSSIAFDAIYVSKSDGGVLFKLVGESLLRVPHSSRLQQEEFFAFLPISKKNNVAKNYLAITRQGTINIFDGMHFQTLPENPKLKTYVQSKYFFRASALGNGLFALATASGGTVIINEKGKIIRILTKATGLPDNGVYFTYPDREGGLWLALNNGLTRVSFPDQLTSYSENLGITTNVENVVRHRGLLYAATGNGLYAWSSPENPGEFGRFERRWQ